MRGVTDSQVMSNNMVLTTIRFSIIMSLTIRAMVTGSLVFIW